MATENMGSVGEPQHVTASPLDSARSKSGGFTFLGLAKPGSLQASAVWRIFRVSNTTSRTQFPNGDPGFKFVFDDAATLNYPST